MFNKKECYKCSKKISKKNNFCPNCGAPLNKKTDEKEWGMLGKNDSLENANPFANPLLGGIGGGMMNKMLNNAIKMLEKEMQKEAQRESKVQNQNQNNFPRTKFRLMINGKEIPLNELNKAPKEEKLKKIKFSHFTEEQIKKFSKLKKSEPKTNINRIGDKLLYEIEIPGVISTEDISIIKLENSIEIKAISDDKSYLKLISINLPIIDYTFSKDLLVLEFKGN